MNNVERTIERKPLMHDSTPSRLETLPKRLDLEKDVAAPSHSIANTLLFSSENLQSLKIYAQIPRSRVPAPSISPIKQAHAKVGGPTRIHAHAYRLIFYAPEKPRNLAQLFPAEYFVFVPDPQRVADPLNLDAQVEATRMVWGKSGERPVRAVGVGDYGCRVACVVAEFEANFDPFCGGNGLYVWRRQVVVV
jgi:hypothetical protein